MAEDYQFRNDVNVRGSIRSSQQGVLIGSSDVAPDSAADGAIYYNTVEQRYYRYSNGAWAAEVSADIADMRTDLQNLDATVATNRSETYSKSEVDAALVKKQDLIKGAALTIVNDVLAKDRVVCTDASGCIGTSTAASLEDVDSIAGAGANTEKGWLYRSVEGHESRVNALEAATAGGIVTPADLSDAVAEAEERVADAYVSKTEHASDLKGKQDSLSTAQMNAADSGITSAKVGTYDSTVSNVTTLISDVAALKTGKQDVLAAGDGITIEGGEISCTAQVEVDEVLDADSANPVQNRAVKAALDSKLDRTGTAEKAKTAAALEGTYGSSVQPVYINNGVPAAIGYVLGTAAKKDETTDVSLGGTGLPTAAAVKAYVDDRVGGIAGMTFKGSTATVPDSPAVGDIWSLTEEIEMSIDGTSKTVEAGTLIIYSESGWSTFSQSVDLSGYVEKSAIPGGSDGQLMEATGTTGTVQPSSETLGGPAQPVYLSGGRLVAATAYANATVSKAVSADVATKAVQDGNGDVIADVYTTRIEAKEFARTADLKAVATTGSYSDLTDRPSIPAAANNGTLTIQRNGATVGTFGADSGADVTANIAVPTTVAEMTDASSYYTKAQVDAAIPDVSVYQRKCIQVSGASIACTSSDSTYSDYPYRGAYANANVTSSDTAIVTFQLSDATGGDMAPVCETYDGGVYVYSKASQTVTGVSILIVKG